MWYQSMQAGSNRSIRETETSTQTRKDSITIYVLPRDVVHALGGRPLVHPVILVPAEASRNLAVFRRNILVNGVIPQPSQLGEARRGGPNETVALQNQTLQAH